MPHRLSLARFARHGALAALAVCSAAFAQPSSGVVWGGEGGRLATAASIGAGAAGAALSAKTLPEAQKLPASPPAPESSIWIERARPVSAQERREQEAVGETIRESGPWTASWVILRVPLDAQETPSAAWEKLSAALSAKAAMAGGDARSVISPQPLSIARGKAFFALNGHFPVQQVSAGSAMGQNEDSILVGAHTSFTLPGQSAEPTANGEVRAQFDRRDRAVVSWSMTVDDGPQRHSEGSVVAQPGQTVWTSQFSRGVLWIMGLQAQRPKASPD